MVHKIDGPGATAQNEWTEGDSILGIPYTEFTAAWGNMVQGELVNFIEAAGLVPTKGNNGQLLSALELLGGGMTANALWNSNFDIWQRYPGGLTFADSALYLSDRWISDTGDSGTALVTPFQLDLGDLFGQANRYHGELPANIYRHDQTIASSTGIRPPSLRQKVFDVRTLAGAECVISFFARSDTAIDVTPTLVQNFGAGGTASAAVETAGTPIAIPGSSIPAFYQQRFTLPTVTGKTIDLGANKETFLEAQFNFPEAETFQIDVWNVRLESGKVPRPNLWVPRELELQRCLSLFEKSYPISTSPYFGVLTTLGAANAKMDVPNPSGQCYNLQTRYMVPKRYNLVAPVWYFGSPAASAADRVGVDGVPVAVTSQADFSSQTTGFPISSAIAAGEHRLQAHWVCDAELPTS